jgi:hypothetical protein
VYFFWSLVSVSSQPAHMRSIFVAPSDPALHVTCCQMRNTPAHTRHTTHEVCSGTPRAVWRMLASTCSSSESPKRTASSLSLHTRSYMSEPGRTYLAVYAQDTNAHAYGDVSGAGWVHITANEWSWGVISPWQSRAPSSRAGRPRSCAQVWDERVREGWYRARVLATHWRCYPLDHKRERTER